MSIRTDLVRDFLPKSIVKTERGTHYFMLDGERHVYPTWRAAATDLAKMVNLHNNSDNLSEIERRVYGESKQPAKNDNENPSAVMPALDGKGLNGAPHRLRPARTKPAAKPAAKSVAAAKPAPKPAAVARPVEEHRVQQRSIRVDIPASVLGELVRGGRARVILSTKK